MAIDDLLDEHEQSERVRSWLRKNGASILGGVVIAIGAIAGWLALPYLIGFAFAPHIGSLVWAVGGYDLVILSAGAAALLGVVCIVGLAAVGRRAQRET